jgi:pimeloyl-ACP methyl ester carboxylesterase
MHGGGGAPKELNDSQWKVMQIYYKDQPSVTGYKYVALRAPNDTWNGFYDTYVPPLIINLIEQFSLFGDVDVNKVYLMGYSHGGYGAFYIGPKIPDRFAAVHCSASAPTDGTISPLTLRNTRFTFMIGEKDTMYGRRERCERFSNEIEKLKAENKGEFPVEMEFKKGFGHGGLPDRDKIKEMYPYVRNVTPKHLSFEAMDSFITEYFWLSLVKPQKGDKWDAIFRDGALVVTTQRAKDAKAKEGKAPEFDVCLDSRHVTYGKPLRVTVDGNSKEVEIKPSLLTLCRSVLKRGDPELAYSCAIRLAGKTE